MNWEDANPGYWRQVPGWTDWGELYNEVAMTTPPGSVIVEVGVAFGRSLLYLAQKIKETGKDIQVCAVDRWTPYPEHHFIYDETAPVVESERVAYECAKKHGGVFPAFIHHLNESGLADYVNVMRMDSIAAAQSFIASGIKPHFVFIDAEHEYEAVKKDLDAWWATGPEWIGGHDFSPKSEINFPGVWKSVFEKWPETKVKWQGSTCFVVRRSEIENGQPDGPYRYEYWKDGEVFKHQ